MEGTFYLNFAAPPARANSFLSVGHEDLDVCDVVVLLARLWVMVDALQENEIAFPHPFRQLLLVRLDFLAAHSFRRFKCVEHVRLIPGPFRQRGRKSN